MPRPAQHSHIDYDAAGDDELQGDDIGHHAGNDGGSDVGTDLGADAGAMSLISSIR